MCWLLLRYGADPNLKDIEGKTPLHYAHEKDHEKQEHDICHLLLSHGADPNLKDSEKICFCYDKTPIQWQKEYEMYQEVGRSVFRIFLRIGSNFF